MASTSSKNTSRVDDYEVFLSFRGPDTRLTFTSCLYEAMVDDGVVVFRDSEELYYGQKIAELLQAVSNSKICVVVLSKGYASSAWCLREIEHAVNLHESNGTPQILPIFLDITPADVKLKTALYSDALNEHKEKHGDDQVGRWKAALENVAEIKGWEGQGQEHGKLIKSIVREILIMLKKKEKFVTDLVGIDERVNDVTELLDIDSRDVRFIGIHGMGGIGKTTLAKIIFNKLYSRFEKCSFMNDVREVVDKTGLVYLQKKLLRDLYNFSHADNSVTDVDEGKRFIQERACSKKVLIVLDDIDEYEQLENLVGTPSSLGTGSRVLITTRDKGILPVVHGIITYEVSQLDFDQALKLFSMHAFKGDSPPYAYLNLSKQVVSKTGGLPLALNVIGSHLYNKNEGIWKETLHLLSKTLPNKVLDKLIISYNALSKNEKCIFLDIACFFSDKKKSRAMDVWEACSLYPRTAIDVLTNKSLIKIYRYFDDNDYIWMHDLLRDLGKEIIFQESPKDVADRSRLWNHEEVLDIVKMKKRKDKIEAIVLDKWIYKAIFITNEELKSLPNLRFLELRAGTFIGDFKNCTSKLKYIYWCSPPLNYRLANFFLNELVHFELSDCEATKDWTGWNLFKVLNKIKVVVLKRCTGLTRTPDLSGCFRLERLSFCDCSKIQVIDSSIGKLKQLHSLFLGGCKILGELPECIGKLISLEHLDLSNTGIVELPNSIRHLKRLKVLMMNFCLIRKLPATIGGLECLEELQARYCHRLEGEIPSEIGRLSFLRVLCLQSTHICALPSTINSLTHLEELNLDYCNDLQELPELPSSLNRLCVRSSSLQSIPNLSNLTNLVELLLWIDYEEVVIATSNTAQPSLVQWIGRSSKLEDLRLRLPIIAAPSFELGELVLASFNSIIVNSCFSKLKCLTKLELSRFQVDEIRLSGLELLRHLEIRGCEVLKRLSISSSLSMLEELVVSKCDSLKWLCDLSKLRKLRDLSIDGCNKLQEIEFFNNFESLRFFYIVECNSLRKIGDLSKCKNLYSIFIHLCPGLQVVEGIDELEVLEELSVRWCRSLEKLIDVHNTRVKGACLINIWECEKLPAIDWPAVTLPLARYKMRMISSGMTVQRKSQNQERKLEQYIDQEQPLWKEPGENSKTKVSRIYFEKLEQNIDREQLSQNGPGESSKSKFSKVHFEAQISNTSLVVKNSCYCVGSEGWLLLCKSFLEVIFCCKLPR